MAGDDAEDEAEDEADEAEPEEEHCQFDPYSYGYGHSEAACDVAVEDPVEEVEPEKPALYHNVFEAPMDDEEDMEDMMDDEMEVQPDEEEEDVEDEEEEEVDDATSYPTYQPTKLIHTWRQASTTVEDYKVPTLADYYGSLTNTSG